VWKPRCGLVGVGPEIEQLERFLSPPIGLALESRIGACNARKEPGPRGAMAPDPDVLEDAKLVKERGALEGADEAALREVARFDARDVRALVEDASACWFVIAADQAERGCLARPVRPDQAMDAVAPNGKGEIVDRSQAAEFPRDVAELENGCLRQFFLPCRILSD